MQRLLFLALTAACLAMAPRPAAAQDGGFPVQTTARTQFLMTDGEVVRREGTQLSPLSQNVKLANGTKINFKNGIVEMPADKLNPSGRKLTLHEGDYVKADGGIVFATPTSAAAAQGKPYTATTAKYETYVQRGPGYDAVGAPVQVSSQQVLLLNKKIELLNQKISLLSQGAMAKPDTKTVDEQLARLDKQLAELK